MTKHSSTPSAPTYAGHAHPAHRDSHGRLVHASSRDTHGRFLPEHEHCFPERPTDGRGNGEPVQERKDFPATGTPESILHKDETAVEIEHSEQVMEAGHPVPERSEREGFEEEQEDWLDKDASR